MAGSITGNPDLADQLSSALDSVEELAKEVTEVLKGLTSGKSIGDVAANVIDIIVKAIDVLINAGLSIIDGALKGSDSPSKALKYLIDNLTEIIVTVLKAILVEVSNVLKGKTEFPQALQKMGSEVLSAMQNIPGTCLKAVTLFLSGNDLIAHGVKTAITGSTEAILKVINEPIKIAIQVLDSVLTSSDPNIQLIKKIVITALTSFSDIANSFIGNITGVAFGTVDPKVAFTNIASLAGEKIGEALEVLANLGEKAAELTGNEGITEAVKTAIKNIKESAERIAKTVKDVGSGNIKVKDGIQALIEEIINLAQTLLSVLLSGILKAISGNDPVSKTLKTIVDGSINAIEEGFSKSLSALSKVISGKINVIDAIKEVAGAFISAIIAFISAATKAVTQLISGTGPIEVAIKRLIELVGSTSSKVAQLLVGVLSGKISSTEAISSIITTVISAARTAGQIGSEIAKSGISKVAELGKAIDAIMKKLKSMVLSNLSAVNNGTKMPLEATVDTFNESMEILQSCINEILQRVADLLKGNGPMGELVSEIIKDGPLAISNSVLDAAQQLISLLGNALQNKESPLDALQLIAKILTDVFNKAAIAASKVVLDLQKFLDSITTKKD